MLNKAIQYGKEFRAKYNKAKDSDSRCRNHGDCLHCYTNRTYKVQKTIDKMNLRLKDYEQQ